MSGHGKVLVIGAGSIGKRHISALVSFFGEIWVVDIDSTKKTDIVELLRNSNISLRFCTSLDNLPKDILFDLIIISNWGPDHFETFKKVQERSVKFLIEKPLVSKLSDLYLMKEFIDKNNLEIVTNLQWNYSGFKERINDMIKCFELGRPLDIQVFGGAKCIVTNGIHYLALANEIYELYPNSVSASLEFSNINPRGEEFFYVGGVSAWGYQGEKFLSIHFQNRSNVSAVMRILFEKAVIEVVGTQMTLRTIPANELIRIEKQTHTRDASNTLLSCDAFVWPNGKDGMWTLIHRMLNNNLKEDFKVGYNATLGIMGALISSEEKHIIEFEENGIRSMIAEKYRNIDWNIT